MPDRPLSGRVALVTGAGRGIGAAIADRLAADGAAVGVNYRRSRAAADAVVDRVRGAGGAAVALAADVGDPEQVAAMVAALEAELGPVDILVNNAGVSRGGPLIGRDHAAMTETITTNLLGALHCCSVVSRGMLRRRWGRIVCISSPVGLRGAAQGQAAYAASKAGLVGLARAVACELSPRGDITSNCVSPGVIPTDMTRLALSEQRERLLDRTPAGRLGAVEEVAAAVAWLVGPDSSFVNGQVLGVDGGFELKFLTPRSAARRRARANQTEVL